MSAGKAPKGPKGKDPKDPKDQNDQNDQSSRGSLFAGVHRAWLIACSNHAVAPAGATNRPRRSVQVSQHEGGP